MDSIKNYLEERQNAWNAVRSAYTNLETKYNDLIDIVNGENAFVKSVFKSYDNANHITSGFNQLKETYESINSTTVNVNDSSDWDSIQSFIDDFSSAKQKLETALASFEG